MSLIYLVYVVFGINLLFFGSMVFHARNDEEEGAKETFYVCLFLSAVNAVSLAHLISINM